MAKDLQATQHTMILRLQDSEDFSAWEEFTDFYWEVITGWARRCGCSDALAQEVFQEVCINLCKNFNYDSSKGKFRPWLKTLVRRRAIDAFRRETRQHDIRSQREYHDNKNDVKKLIRDNAAALAEIDNTIDPNSDAEGLQGDLVWLNAMLSQAMRNLYGEMDDQTYKSFTMYVLDSLPVAEVAQRLGVSEAVVYQHRTRFIKRLEKEFVALLKNVGDAEVESMETDSGLSLEKLLDQRLSGEGGIKSSGLKALLAEMIADQRHLRGTMIVSQAPEDLCNRLFYVQGHLKANPKEGQEAAFLLIADDNTRWYFITEKALLIGRSSKDGIQLNMAGISGLHASVRLEGNNIIFKDENSTNGSFLNGVKLEGEAMIKSGDVVQVGEASLIF
ncbi:MAG: sigma-70 family RNA polymerase sigma factor [Lentisphaeraceae bacterium]|nr:sigma-70 family RNA polymerase sigma factor [Lentisphaeraceae bacterium]